VKLVERQVGDREYLGIVVKPLDSDDHRVVLVPVDRKEMTEAVRRLREGMILELGCLRDGGHDWVRSLDARWGEEGEGARREERVVLRIEREGREIEREVDREEVRRRGDREEIIREMQRDIDVMRRLDRPERREGEGWRSPEAMAREEARRKEMTRAEGREGEMREGLAGRIERLMGQFRELVGQVARMEREIRALRTENERLRRMLGERGQRLDREPRREGERLPMEGRVRGEREAERTRFERGDRAVIREREGGRERPAAREGDRGRPVVREREREGDRVALPRLPDSLAGFQGVLSGEVVRKLDRGFVLRLGKVGQVWDGNKAENPRAAVGKTMVVMIRPEEGGGENFMRVLRGLRVGQRVLVEAFHLEGEHLTVVEQLRAVE
jgi:hypothetical protein